MRIKKIILKNIRSYKYQEIEFPKGSILLSGDIGSGKTSILLSIEFALFGLQPGQRGSALLRSGEKEGGVELEMEIDGRDIILKRTLKRGNKTISQESASIIIDGVEQELSITELKNKVLSLLNYPKEFAKKQNTLFRFTVYTPQEEMKQIILQDSETRRNTIRYVFGIDKYKRILENVNILIGKLREERRLKEALVSSSENDFEELKRIESRIQELKVQEVDANKVLEEKKNYRKKVEDEKKLLEDKINEKRKIEQEIEKTKIMLSNKIERTETLQKSILEINKQIEELNSLKFDSALLKEIEMKISVLKKKKEELSEERLRISSEINSLKLKNEENERTKNKISKLEICPTCLQDVDAVYKSNIINKMDSEISQNIEKIKEDTLKIENLLKEERKLDSEILELQSKVDELRLTKVKIENLNEKKALVETYNKEKEMLEKDISLLNEQISLLKSSLLEFQKYDLLFEKKTRELEDAFREEKKQEILLAEIKKEIDMLNKNLEVVQERIKKTEEIKKQISYIVKLEGWFSKSFAPLISNIEKNVMIKLRTEFSKTFEKWFSMLVSDNFNVRLDETFTPIIEQQDYEIDYAYLSGGERTAIALAYRLALNQVINSFLSKIKTKGIVILDEPTDGFSEQQLEKMRDVLAELNSEQLIIVSHEQKIESFVENVIKLKKEDGESNLEN